MKLPWFCILCMVLLGCSKDKDEKDTSAPVITLSSPVNGTVYAPGQPIMITGSITDDKYIAEVHIHVTNTNTGALLMDVHVFPNSTTADINHSLIASVGFNYRIQVIAKDRAVNEAILSRDVSCN